MRQHRHALREGQGGQQAALDALAHAGHLGADRRALHAPVAAQVVVGPVPVVLAVGLVVLVLEAHQVVQRESVVAGDEVDARERPPIAGREEIAAPGEP